MALASNQTRRLRAGVVATVLVGLLARLLWGPDAVLAAMAFGALATAIQLVAARIATRLGAPATPDNLRVYVLGMVLRIAGVAAIAVAVSLDRASFPPGAAALGYLGSLLPLMWLETRLA